MDRELVIVIGIIISAFFFIKSFAGTHRFIDNTVPSEIIKLVKQAHRHEAFATEPHIFVGADMREKLAYPLTVEQARLIASTQYPVTENNFQYELVEHTNKDLIVVKLLITIDYCDTMNGLDLHFHNVPMCLKCKGSKKRGGLELIAVEHD